MGVVAIRRRRGCWGPLGRPEPHHSRARTQGRVLELLPNDLSVLDSGSRVIPYVQAATDRKALAFVDPFALSHAFLYQVLPKLVIVTAGRHAGGVELTRLTNTSNSSSQ